MSKFNVGDRVRIISFMGNDFSPLTGITGTVLEDDRPSSVIVSIDRPVPMHEPWSISGSSAILLLDKELEYEDNGARGIEDLYCDQPSLPENIRGIVTGRITRNE